MPPALQPALECRLRCLDALDAPLVEAVLGDEFEGAVCEGADVGEEGAVGVVSGFVMPFDARKEIPLGDGLIKNGGCFGGPSLQVSGDCGRCETRQLRYEFGEGVNFRI